MTPGTGEPMEVPGTLKSLVTPGPARRGLGVAVLLMALDQLTKQAVLLQIPEGRTITVLPILDFVLVWNTGISYGLFDGSGGFGRTALSLLGLLIAGFLLFLMARTSRKWERLGFGLIIGGALGNIVDRVIYGGVIDFISFHVANYYWYVFNLADVWITLGVVLILLDGFVLSGKNSED